MLIYAKQPVNYIINNHPNKIRTLYLAKEIDKKEYSRLMKMDFEIKRIPPDAAGKMCKNASHQGVLAEIDEYKLHDYKTFLNYEFILVLSGLTDVGNIGAIIRSAYALGVDGVIACGIKSLPLEAVVRTSTGALLDMPFAIETNIHNVMNDLKMSGFCTYGADMGGIDIRDIKVKPKRALFLGSEGEGLSARVSTKLDEIISIKMSHEFDSLNVSVAGAILMDRMRI
ncbi:MAG: 23S rRNA (guanosine(2251)-2'-O)-methyltransferase RlmB [Sulfurimonas sp. RIFOXYD12_FULL_33_39]|uniref:23S rRNA (guanosine(2251)-2'-O)-methyltransferase RlmB n=1 Tax=unclassified Sulfurimonas TaxID=2623549 RepID=UPI0008C71812|nr:MULTISPECIES: 23S rRNA (guanosine(2251)-2'-O)-methyltransferase RlmB [unclassified Sulfurimonas]OHE06716.1 MAG: 23S rRNA (guanosine(2251)-2'-O)-methyltransferase RlmB [Sulfurimonas sp. RIFCSPLOWO2_12_FULL_34_6]OHE09787.1 MAG: 23S rRNA (guanosine(2251)-2'-O)-methyltransferase RlmB [Sulfurimonas sp. RIFOXYD12_FULL_33_39]OHE13705.1 MAG: 23S rRNA (guanosine(2251)-2'-O)-methyltransferase RlmB [Sulfurimonas sp. RIFOXYD2_FULL_34_21]DAB28080.1 MAG TPA: 23S rRNA (guanosine(2251)-2'-O)-methyltransfera